MTKVAYPWDIDLASDKHKWGLGYLEKRLLPSEVYGRPDDKLARQIRLIVEWSLGSRNWIVCICESTSYIRTLFGYVLASYVFTTKERAIAVDVDDLTNAIEDPEGDMRDIIEHADLLLVNYCDPANPQLKWKRGAIANILHRRKYRKLATIVNVFVRNIPDKMDSAKALKLSEAIIEMFGETTYELFTSQDSKRVVIRPDKESRHGDKKQRGKKRARK
jgi:hypothetical protein